MIGTGDEPAWSHLTLTHFDELSTYTIEDQPVLRHMNHLNEHEMTLSHLQMFSEKFYLQLLVTLFCADT